MDIPKKNIELENHAKCELLKANLSSTFSYRRAFLLGRQDALKNMESSSRVIHSQPTEGFYYWVRLFPSREWEVARPRLRNDDKMWFCFTNGSHKRSDEVSDWIKTPIAKPKG